MGRSRGGLTTKIHALVDAEGRQVLLELTAGQAGDAPVAARLLEAVAPGATMIADKAYDTDGIRAFVAAKGAWPNIPPRSRREETLEFSRWVYRQRNLFERFFNRIKQMRGWQRATTAEQTISSPPSRSWPCASGPTRNEAAS